MIEVPENMIVVITDHQHYDSLVDDIIFPMRGNKKRDWFVKHTYFCLPLVIGNQYGFGIRSLKTFEAVWTGGDAAEHTVVTILEDYSNPEKRAYPGQKITSHFGMGTVTIQNRFHFRTPPGVNLMTINPPNYWIDGVQHMTGVVETDNLRRDFTFNLKLTRPGHRVKIERGDLIGCVIPIPRYFVDSFIYQQGKELFTNEQLEEERNMGNKLGVERSTVDQQKPHRNGRRYFNGEDADGNKFPDHQKRIEPYPTETRDRSLDEQPNPDGRK